MPKSQDLFDDSQMSFGDHLEELRKRLIRAIAGLAIGVTLALLFGQNIVAIARKPIDSALLRQGLSEYKTDDIGGKSLIDHLSGWFKGSEEKEEEDDPETSETKIDQTVGLKGPEIKIYLSPNEMAGILHNADPESYPKPPKDESGKLVSLKIQAIEFDMLRKKVVDQHRLIAINVQEGFMTYLKVSLVAGLVLSSPWVFYQGWLFIAVGLHDHERKYVYLYGGISLGLFLLGAYFCFEFVFPIVLDFLLKFTYSLGVTPQIRLSEWISFAILLPVMFGLSFQLPIVMLFLERLSIFEVKTYREQRRMAVLVIAVLSMMLTPAEPVSMIMMMVPLTLLYELGIILCGIARPSSPFEETKTA